MTLVDSADSILMLYSYSGFPTKNKWTLFSRKVPPNLNRDNLAQDDEKEKSPHRNIDSLARPVLFRSAHSQSDALVERERDEHSVSEVRALEPQPSQSSVSGSAGRKGTTLDHGPEIRLKLNVMSNLSIILTIVSIMVALRYGFCGTFR